MSGKGLAIVSGILVIIGMFFLTWFTIDTVPFSGNAHGLALLNNIGTMFSDPGTYATALGIPTNAEFAVYIIAGFYIFALFSGFLILIGAKSRASAIVGAIMPILLFVLILFASLQVLPNNVGDFVGVFVGADWVEGVLPFTLALNTFDVTSSVNLGTYVFGIGGILGLVSGIMGREN